MGEYVGKTIKLDSTAAKKLNTLGLLRHYHNVLAFGSTFAGLEACRLAQLVWLPQYACGDLRKSCLSSTAYADLLASVPILSSLKPGETTAPLPAATCNAGQGFAITKCVMTEGGRSFLVANHDGVLKLINTSTLQSRVVCSGGGIINDFSTNKSAVMVAVAFDEGNLKIFNAHNGRAIQTLSNLNDPPVACEYAECEATDVVMYRSANGGCFLWWIDSGTTRNLCGRVAYATSSSAAQRVATCSLDGTVPLWDLMSGKSICTFRGHSAPVNKCAFDDEGKQLVSCADDHTVRIWGLEAHALLTTLTGHSGPVTHCSFLRGAGELAVASCSKDGTARLWDTEGHIMSALNDTHPIKDQVLHFSKGPVDCPQAFQCLRSNERVVIGTNFGFSVWNINSNIEEFVVPGRWVWNMNEDNGVLVGGDHSGQVSVWELETALEANYLTAFAQDTMGNGPGGRISSQLAESRFSVASIGAGPASAGSAGNFGPLNRNSASSTVGGALGMASSSSSSATMQRRRSSAMPGGSALTMTRTSGTIVPGKGFAIHSVPASNRASSAQAAPSPVIPVRLMTFACASGSDEYFFAATPEGTVLMYEHGSTSPIDVRLLHFGSIKVLTVSKNSKIIMTAHENNAYLWNQQSGNLQHTLRGHQAAVLACAFRSDGRVCASGSEDGTVCVWDSRSGEMLRILSGHAAAVLKCAFDISGEALAVGCNDGTVFIHKTYPPVTNSIDLPATSIQIREHKKAVKDVVFNAYGTTLLTCSEDCALKVIEWNSMSVTTLTGHRASVTACAFLDNSELKHSRQIALSISLDGTLRFWLCSSGDPLSTLPLINPSSSFTSNPPHGLSILSVRAGLNLVTGNEEELISLFERTLE